MKYKAGVAYSGQFAEGEENGAGHSEYLLANYEDGTQRGEAAYRGQWKDGKCHGKGEMSYFSGSKFTGDWVEYQRHGRGTYTWAGGKHVSEWNCLQRQQINE